MRLRHGLNPYADRGQPLAVRFHNRYWIDESGCWLWTSTIASTGYARISRKAAHRVSYELHKGPVPTGLVLDHLCRIKHCVNPDHLEAVTQAENVRRHNELLGEKQYAVTCSRGHDQAVYGHHRSGYRRCAECDRETARRRHHAKKTAV